MGENFTIRFYYVDKQYLSCNYFALLISTLEKNKGNGKEIDLIVSFTRKLSFYWNPATGKATSWNDDDNYHFLFCCRNAQYENFHVEQKGYDQMYDGEDLETPPSPERPPPRQIGKNSKIKTIN